MNRRQVAKASKAEISPHNVCHCYDFEAHPHPLGREQLEWREETFLRVFLSYRYLFSNCKTTENLFDLTVKFKSRWFHRLRGIYTAITTIALNQRGLPTTIRN
jgi:hypothetical protein